MVKHFNIVSLLLCHPMKNSWWVVCFEPIFVESGFLLWAWKISRGPGSCFTKGWQGTFLLIIFCCPTTPDIHWCTSTNIHSMQNIFLGGAFCDGIKGWQGTDHVDHLLPHHPRVNIRIASLVATLVGGIFWTHSLTFFCGVRFLLLQTWVVYLAIATW